MKYLSSPGNSVTAALLSLLFLVSPLLTSSLWGAEKDSIESVRKELEDLKKSQKELQKELDKMMDKGEDNLKDEDGSQPVTWKELTLLNSKITFYGFARLDAFYDDSRLGPNNKIPAFVLSEDPAAAGTGVGALKDQDEFTMHPRLTRLGLKIDGPTIKELMGAKVDGKIEVDFYNIGADARESRTALRMRKAYMRLIWGDFFVLAGQTYEIISPLYPKVNNDLLMWGAGNTGDRRPQFRLQYQPKVGPGTLYIQAMAGLTGAIDNQGANPANIGVLDGELSGLPTLQFRTAFRLPLTKKHHLEIGVWAHRAWEKTQVGPDTRHSYAFGADLLVPLVPGRLWIKGEIYHGLNTDDIRGGILQGVNAVTGEEIRSTGGWIEMGLKTSAFHTIHAGYTIDDPHDEDLNRAPASTNSIRERNQTVYLANRFSFGPVGFALDYIFWRTDYQGFEKGNANRINVFFYFKF